MALDVMARYDEPSGRYTAEVRGELWYSDDGDEWVGRDGEPIDHEYFHSASIKLIGGPRDGEWVG